MTNHLIHAYRQAPWRVQLQWIVFFLLGLVLVAFVASIYLSISARSATIGREIQFMESKSEQIGNQIADLETQLAMLTSATTMKKRAKDLGFVAADSASQLYLVIPGYTGRQTAVMAPPPGPGMVAVPLILPNYTQSLWEWMFQAFLNTPIMKDAPLQ